MGEVVALFVKVLMPFLYGIVGSLVGLLFVWPSAENTVTKLRATVTARQFQTETFLTVRPMQGLETFGAWSGWDALVSVSRQVDGWFQVAGRVSVFEIIGAVGLLGGCVVLMLMWSDGGHWSGAPATSIWISLAILAQVSQPAWPVVLIGFSLLLGLLILAGVLARFSSGIYAGTRYLINIAIDLGLALFLGFIRLAVFAYR